MDRQIATSVHRTHSGQKRAAGYEDQETEDQAKAFHSAQFSQ